jgi:hypothetical protein
MFLLHFLPDGFLQLIINIVLLSGAVLTGVGFFLVGFIPGLRNYKTLIQIVGVVLLALGIYWKGGYGVEMEWRAKVAELEAKVKLAEEKSQQVNTVIETKVVTKVKHIKDVQVKIQQQIVEKEKIINGECVVPKEAVELLNKAAEKPVGVAK